MKPSPLPVRSRKASALLTVVMLTAVMAMLTASILSYTLTERRGNERNRLILRAKNAAENISAYAAEQITTKLYRLRSANQIAFMTGTNAIDLPPVSVLTAADKTYTGTETTMEVRAGLTTSTGLVFIDPATNPTNANAGLQVNTASVPIISKATGRHTALGTVTSYSQQDLAVDFIPLFQFAVFYNMDMEIWPGADMTMAGPVHCNGELSARGATGFTPAIRFTDRTSSSGGFYADQSRQGPWIGNTGTSNGGAGGGGSVNFQNAAGTVTNIYGGTGPIWRDHKMGGGSETTTTQNNFKVFATTTYGLNLRTSVHGVTPLVLPSVSDYKEVDDPATDEDDRSNGRQTIARPDASDNVGLQETKLAYKCGLYIIVNPDDKVRNGYIPSGSTVVAVSMRARSYRCWLQTVDSSLNHSIAEVILPGQPSYGPLNAFVNNFPNAYRTNTSIGHNQVLRTIQGGGVDVAGTGHTAGATAMTGFSNAYFFDLRRATNNNGAGALLSTGSYRSGNAYTPRPIVKIDFDMTRFRMTVERTMSGTSGSYVASDTASSIYYPSLPTLAAQWTNSIFNTAGVPANYNLGLGLTFLTLPTATTLTAPDPYRMYFAPADPTLAATITLIATDPGQFAVGGTDLAHASATKPWYDGITVYVHSVDAETRNLATNLTPTAPAVPTPRIDSGVRLWNGRGPLISLPGASYPGKTGLTFVTNDAAYIIGHYNADGTINSTATSTTALGGYSARYPDVAAEMLTSVMADAITILSQPIFSSTAPYPQTSGWSDSLSATSANGGIAAWATTQPSGTNDQDGINNSISPANMPNLGNIGGTLTARATKFGASQTEISTCLMVGIVPTNHNPTGLTDGPPSSGANGQAGGGVHNFPRLLEIWDSAASGSLFMRGSMVAMFESRVAMEPWNLRIYSAPGRFWGLHQSLRNANHDLPLEPILLGARRLGFKEITAAEYATMKTTIEALPH